MHYIMQNTPMKKFILISVATACTFTLFAQRNNVEFGIKGGVNFARFKVQPSHNTDSRVGFHVGMLTHIHLSEHFALQPELMYSGQGADYGSDHRDRFNYVNIPVLVQFMFGEGFRLQTGPQIGFLANATSDNDDVEADIDDNFKRGDFSWSFGGGYLGYSGLGVDVRYNLGISNIAKTGPDVENRVWQAGLFYQFRDRNRVRNR